MGSQAPDGWQNHPALVTKGGKVYTRRGNDRVYDRYNDDRGDRYLVSIGDDCPVKVWVDAESIEQPYTYINQAKASDDQYVPGYDGSEYYGPYPGDPYRYRGPDACLTVQESIAADKAWIAQQEQEGGEPMQEGGEPMTAKVTPDSPEFLEAMRVLRNAHDVTRKLFGDRYPQAVLQLMHLGTFQLYGIRL